MILQLFKNVVEIKRVDPAGRSVKAGLFRYNVLINEFPIGA